MVCKALGSKVIHDLSLFLSGWHAALSGTHRFMKGYDLIPKYPLYVCNKRELQSFPINCRATNWRPGWFLLSGRKTCLPLITTAFSGGRWGHLEADPRWEQKMREPSIWSTWSNPGYTQTRLVAVHQKDRSNRRLQWVSAELERAPCSSSAPRSFIPQPSCTLRPTP